MTLPSGGPISLRDVNVELGRSAGGLIRLGETDVRSLAGKATGPISLADLRGKSNLSGTHVMYVEQMNSFFGYFAYTDGPKGSLTPKTFKGIPITGIYQSATYLYLAVSATVSVANSTINTLVIDGVVFSCKGKFADYGDGLPTAEIIAPANFLWNRRANAIPVSFT